jgi:hypothetical protein
MLSWHAFVVAAVYFSLIVGLLIVASRKYDAEGATYAWLVLSTPWIWLLTWLNLGVFVTFLALILNAASVYTIVALGIAAYQKVFGEPDSE